MNTSMVFLLFAIATVLIVGYELLRGFVHLLSALRFIYSLPSEKSKSFSDWVRITIMVVKYELANESEKKRLLELARHLYAEQQKKHHEK